MAGSALGKYTKPTPSLYGALARPFGALPRRSCAFDQWQWCFGSKSPAWCVRATGRSLGKPLGFSCWHGNSGSFAGNQFSKTFTATGDGAGLARLVLSQLPEGKVAIHLCGTLRADEPSLTLTKNGWQVVPVPLYEMRPCFPLAAVGTGVFGRFAGG